MINYISTRVINLKVLLLATIAFYSCTSKNDEPKSLQAQNESIDSSSVESTSVNNTPDLISKTNPDRMTIQARFEPPVGYERVNGDAYADFLRNLPLKPSGSLVKYYDGREKARGDVYEAVVDLKIGKRDLHQCADAIMRLRAEYLWKEKRYDDIHFNFTNGFRVDYSEWMKGKRMIVKGNKTYWVNKNAPSNTYNDLWSYLELIFTYAGTLSLSKELQPVKLEEMKIGDVFIQGGSPGHAVLVVDMAKNEQTGKTIFMLAQSYMPAQEIQILRNNDRKEISPWYALEDIGNYLITPEWNFKSTDLKRFD